MSIPEDVALFLRALSRDWFALMSGPVGVLLAIAGLIFSVVLVPFLAAAVGCLFFAVLRLWLLEHRARDAAEEQTKKASQSIEPPPVSEALHEIFSRSHPLPMPTRFDVGERNETSIRIYREPEGTTLVDLIRGAKKNIRVVSYSLASIKGGIEGALRVFFEAGGDKSARFLLLDPDDYGLIRKATMEAHGPQVAYSAEGWSSSAAKMLSEHRDDLRATIATILRWQGTWGSKQVGLRLYRETPSLKGLLVDDDSLYYSSYMYDPFGRGLWLPHFLVTGLSVAPISRFDCQNHLAKKAFENWFDINFALGKDPR